MVASRLAKKDRVTVIAIAIAIVAAGSAAFVMTGREKAPRQGPVGVDGSGAEERAANVEDVARRATTSSATSRPHIGALARTTDAVPDVDPVVALRRGLASDDDSTRIEAVEAAVSATAVETLGELQKFELAKDPEVAPTVIHAVALLGASADGKRRDDAAGTLARWLRDEMKREGADVPGNISNLVEALGNVGGTGAVEALTRALDGQELPLHVETLAVMKLGELGDGSARPAVERFAQRVAALAPAEGIDDELRVEAIAAANTTLARI